MGPMPLVAKVVVAVTLAVGLPVAAYFAGRWIGPTTLPSQPEQAAVSPGPSRDRSPQVDQSATPVAPTEEAVGESATGPTGAAERARPPKTGEPQKTPSSGASDANQQGQRQAGPGTQPGSGATATDPTTSSNPSPTSTSTPTQSPTATATSTPTDSPTTQPTPSSDAGASPAAGSGTAERRPSS
jgi:hypothetical protein